MGDKIENISDELENELENEVDDLEVDAPQPTRYELLGKVLDAELDDDGYEVAKAAFHDFLTIASREILQPEVVDGEEYGEFDVELEVEPTVSDDDDEEFNVDLDQHIAAVTSKEDGVNVGDEPTE